MISFICSSREPKEEFKEHIIKMCGVDKNKTEFIFYKNNGEYSLTELYNKGLKESKYNINVYLHDDIIIDTKQFGQKIINHFNNNPEYGIIGVAGSKYLPKNGKWWEDSKKMYGRVKHTHEGKTWLSAYSNDLGKELEDVVIVDGVFFAVNKQIIKKEFNESVTGFHFYDVNFCFENYLSGVKIGVFTNIRINHMSIGQTNDAWENSRIKFSEKYADVLPVNIKKTFNNGEKMKVLIGCLSFKEYTGSELYVYELAKGLINSGCDVSICSNIGNPLESLIKPLGVKLYTLQEPPGFKLGDGNWVLNTVNGKILSQVNVLYKLEDVSFDILHLNHKPITEHLLKLYPNIPAICSIHSEVISLEEPVMSEQIKKYIAIRPEIKDFLINKFGIIGDKISVIYNPIDEKRFYVKEQPKNVKKRVLFVGTIEKLRKNTIQDLINKTKENNEELWVVGRKHENYLDDMIINQPHVKYFEPEIKIEKFIKQCDEVASILLGRTCIEGWLCGKPSWIYDIDNYGNIKSKKLYQVPSDVNKFNSNIVIEEIINEYKKSLGLFEDTNGKIIFDKNNNKLNNENKVSIIIPTKGNVDLLFNCVNSFFSVSKYENFIIYIADTGSSEEELSKINEKYKTNNKVKLIKYNYYNFGSINNDVVFNKIDTDSDLVLFCNNDIELINDALTKMVDVYQKNKNCGTVGCRLHFGNGLIQHAGIIIENNFSKFSLTHKGLMTQNNYYNGIEINKWGSTGAFLLLSKELFVKIGGFVKTTECFEDVILNLNSTLLGYDNYFVGDAVCYHLESQTRKNNPDKNKREFSDYNTFLLPILIQNKKILFN